MRTKLNVVAKAAKDQGKCGGCDAIILKGDSYRWWKFRFGGRHIRCMNRTCDPKPWQLESNSKSAALMEAGSLVAQAQEAEDPSDAASFLRDAMAMVEEVCEEVQNAVDSWQEGNLANAQRTYDWEEAAQNLQSWLDGAEDWASVLEGIESVAPAGSPIKEGTPYREVDEDMCDAVEGCRDALDELADVQEAIEEIPDCEF